MEKVKLNVGLEREYVIPCFQREYSWGEEEIEELIKNLKELKNKAEYCLGIVTVKKDKEKYLLIDGQQRMTTLYLISIYCGYITSCDQIRLSSEYDSLISENRTNNLEQIILNEIDELSPNFKKAWRIIKKEISEEDKKIINELIKESLYYYEVSLADKTNINHYFEVMNSRGVQLSRSDIVKSFLMNKLDDDNDKLRLNYLWYDLEKMNNETKNIKNFEDITEKNNIEYKTINEILCFPKDYNKRSQNDIESDDNSILTFDYFLLYTIKLYKNKASIDINSSGEFNLNNLIKEYNDIFKNSKKEEIIDFFNFLISIKNIYDKYIVKFNNSTETWKLGVNNNDMMLLQACLRVSFVNRKLMHWIYITLAFFYNKNDNNETDISEYINLMKKYIREKYVKDFINKNKSNNYRTDFDTPVIILNYLDYLIKINYKKIVKDIPEAKGIQYDSFTFKFRNSIEHFMPRSKENAPGESNSEWVKDFGNLALLSYGTNTKMQNASPDEKAKHFDKDLSGYSLKLQIMSKIALDKKREWNEKETQYITDKCIKILEHDLNEDNN